MPESMRGVPMQRLLTLENQIERLSDPFMRKGLQLLVDGVEIETPREAWRIDAAAIGVDPARHDAGMAERLAQGVGGAERVVVACPPDRIEDWRVALTSLSAKGEILVNSLLAVVGHA